MKEFEIDNRGLTQTTSVKKNNDMQYPLFAVMRIWLTMFLNSELLSEHLI